MIYIFTFFLIFFLSYQLNPGYLRKGNEEIVPTRRRKKYCLIISIWLLFLLTFRHAYVGTDTQNYYHLFCEAESFGFSVILTSDNLLSEFGFYALNSFLASHGLPFRVLVFISAALYIYSISLLIFKYSERPAISYFIFLTFGFFIFNTTMRQCFAVSFSILSTISLLEKKRVRSIIFVLLAMTMHATAIVYVVAYILKFLKFNKKSCLLIIASAIIISTFSALIFSTLSEMTGKNYDERETTGYFSQLITLIFLIIGYINRKSLKQTDRYWFFMLTFSILLFPLAKFNPAFFRIQLYFNIFEIIYIPSLLSNKFRVTQALYVLIFIVGLYKFYIGTWLAGIRVSPYVFYWEDYYDYNPSARALDLYPPD